MEDESMLNEMSLDTVCASLCYAMGIDAPNKATKENALFREYIDKKAGGEKFDRIFMYNPDAIAQWVFEKYPYLFYELSSLCDLRLPLRCVMSSVTPVCFATMYTGAQPQVHGIMKYEKPVVRTDTVFDVIIRKGMKAAILAQTGCSMSKIFLERDMDYFIYDTVEEVNAKAAELILNDKHDFIAVYNGNYDSTMHKYGPESMEALAEARINTHAFATFVSLIKNNWKNHRTLYGFAMDHGCHEIDGNCGSHGLDMPEDLNIVHLYGSYIGNTE
jgi:predicted AlkP superfamily pyrophosphatase or phosphodiesterase